MPEVDATVSPTHIDSGNVTLVRGHRADVADPISSVCPQDRGQRLRGGSVHSDFPHFKAAIASSVPSTSRHSTAAARTVGLLSERA